MRQLLIEAVLLSLAGAFSGVLVGRALAGGLVALSPLDLPGGDALPFDGWVFGFSIMMGLVAGLVFGLLPALAATGGRVERLLRQSGRGGGPGERESRTRDVLVVAQLALSLVLLSGAGLLMRSLQNLRAQDLGFRAAGVMTFEVNLPLARYDAGARARFHEELHDRLGAIPGVRAVAAVSRLPVTGRTLSWGVRRVTGDGSAMEPHVSADQRAVQGDYFGLARIPVRAGRAFGPQDRAGAPGRVVISESLARMLFPEGDAMGGRISVAGDPLEIIGVVGDVAVDARGEVAPVVYHAHHQFADNRNWSMRQLVAVDGTVPGLMDAVRHALATIDPALVLHRPAPFDSVIRRDTATDRFVTLLLAAFAGLAVLLAAVGVYGVLAWSVSRRRHEIGVRMALGARATDIRGMIVRRGVLLVVASLGLGLAGAFALTRLLDAFLFGVGVRDPLTFALASGVIGAVALTASLVPAISATRVDPVSAFRSD
jgi:putative ABC transport system permease protein